MRNLLSLITVILCTASFFSCETGKPNVILIMADDMGAECLSIYGGSSYQTPNLEKMADEGLRISHCIAQPFFICYPMVLVHEPFVPTPDTDAWPERAARYKNDTSYFAHMMRYTDMIVGKIQKKLVEEGIHEKTILIFTADNGTHTSIVSQKNNRRVRGAKGNTISDGVHVPLLISWPQKIRKASVYEGLIEFSDFFATLADMVGANVETDGHSFLPLLEGPIRKEKQ